MARASRNFAFALFLSAPALASCAPSTARAADCNATIAKLEHQRESYVQRTVPELKKLQQAAKGKSPAPENQAAFADFETQIEGFENRIHVERLKCPGATKTAGSDAPLTIKMSPSDAPNQ